MRDKYILIVDRTASFRDTLSPYLGRNYFILHAENDQAAIKLLQNNTIDLVIIWHSMPHLNGIELLRTIKADRALRDIPVMAVIDIAEQELEIQALELGAIDIIARPFSTLVALQRIKNILRIAEKEIFVRKGDSSLLELQQANLILQAVAEEAPTGILIYEFSLVGTSKILFFNDRLASVLGYSKEDISDILTSDLTSLLHPDDAPAIVAKILFSLKNGLNFSVVCRALHKNNSYILLSIAATVIQQDSQKFVFYLSCTGSEIATMKDSLTGLFSREALVQYAGEQLQDSSLVCTLFILNVDNFDSLNDNFGRDFGDRVLVEVAEKLKKIFRSQDILSRTGGDEFCIFLSNEISSTVVEMRAQQIISAVFRQYSNWRCNVEISASVGIATSLANGADFETLYAAANTAMLNVKKTGKNNFSIA